MKAMNKKHFHLIMTPMEVDPNLSYLQQEEGFSFPNETFSGLASLCTILKGIQDRLIREGYSIMDGEIISPQGVMLYDKNTTTQ